LGGPNHDFIHGSAASPPHTCILSFLDLTPPPFPSKSPPFSLQRFFSHHVFPNPSLFFLHFFFTRICFFRNMPKALQRRPTPFFSFGWLDWFSRVLRILSISSRPTSYVCLLDGNILSKTPPYTQMAAPVGHLRHRSAYQSLAFPPSSLPWSSVREILNLFPLFFPFHRCFTSPHRHKFSSFPPPLFPQLGQYPAVFFPNFLVLNSPPPPPPRAGFFPQAEGPVSECFSPKTHFI